MFGRWESRLLSKLSQVRWQSSLMILLAFQICCRKYVSHYCRFLNIFILQLYNEIDGLKRVERNVIVTYIFLKSFLWRQPNWIISRSRGPGNQSLLCWRQGQLLHPLHLADRQTCFRLLPIVIDNNDTHINANAISAFIFTFYKIACLKYFIPYDLFEKEWARILTIKKR